MTNTSTILKSIKLFGYTLLVFMAMSCSGGSASTLPNTTETSNVESPEFSSLTEIDCEEQINSLADWDWDATVLSAEVKDEKRRYIKCSFVGHLISNPKIYTSVFLQIDEYKNVTDSLLSSESVKITDVSGSPLNMNIIKIGDVTYYECLQIDGLVTCLTKTQYSYKQLTTRVTVDEKAPSIIIEELINSILSRMEKALKTMP